MFAQINYIAVIGVALILAVFLLAKVRELAEYLAERKQRREFEKFEDVISGNNTDPAAARKYFSGEVKLPEEVNVIIPELIKTEELANLHEPIDSLLKEAEIGYVVRAFETGDSCGFDLRLNDFVKGVDLIRRQLVERSAPRGTLIEYSGGDLTIYEDD